MAPIKRILRTHTACTCTPNQSRHPKSIPESTTRPNPKWNRWGQVLAPLWKTLSFFVLSRRGGRVAKFHFATPTLSCFFLTNGLKIKFWNNYRAGRPGWGRAGLGPGPGARVPERLSGSRAFRRAARLRKECQGAECLSGSGPPNSVSL